MDYLDGLRVRDTFLLTSDFQESSIKRITAQLARYNLAVFSLKKEAFNTVISNHVLNDLATKDLKQKIIEYYSIKGATRYEHAADWDRGGTVKSEDWILEELERRDLELYKYWIPEDADSVAYKDQIVDIIKSPTFRTYIQMSLYRTARLKRIFGGFQLQAQEIRALLEKEIAQY